VSIASSKRLKLLPDVPTFKEQGFDLDESMWRGFAFKKGVPDEAVQYVTKVLQDVVSDQEWEDFCNETFVFSSFEKQDVFTKRINTEIEETNYYLNKAGLLVSYIKEGPRLIFIFLLILAGICFLVVALNRFRIKNISYDQLFAAGLFSVALFFYYQTTLFIIPQTIDITSPALIPRIWVIVLLLLSVLLFVKSKNEKFIKSDNSPITVLIIIVLLVAYLAAMQLLGYYFTTPIFILSTMYLLKYRKKEFMIMNAFGFVIFSYLIFSKLLHIDLPLGMWFM
jgi:hypothetical protein